MGPSYFIIAILGCADGVGRLHPGRDRPDAICKRSRLLGRDRRGAGRQQRPRFPDPRRRMPARCVRAARVATEPPRVDPGGAPPEAEPCPTPSSRWSTRMRCRATKASSSPSPTGSRAIRAPDRLKGKVALITGADSGIGRAVAALFAREGADIAILYLCEHDDAAKTKAIVEKEGRRAITIAGDLGDKSFCERRGRADGRASSAGSTSSSTMPASSIPTRTSATSPRSSSSAPSRPTSFRCSS